VRIPGILAFDLFTAGERTPLQALDYPLDLQSATIFKLSREELR
jgi:hypothetical protein